MPTASRFPTAINIVNIKKRKKSRKYANEFPCLYAEYFVCVHTGVTLYFKQVSRSVILVSASCVLEGEAFLAAVKVQRIFYTRAMSTIWLLIKHGLRQLAILL